MNISSPEPLIDSFFEYNTKNILYGNYVRPPNKYIEKIMVSIIKSYTLDHEFTDTENQWAQFYDNLYKADKNYTYDDIINALGSKHTSNNNSAPTAEYILASAMYGYKDVDSELLTRTLNTFCRPVKLEGKNEWLDNWTLNGPGNALNFVFWNNFDSNDVVTISKVFQEMKTEDSERIHKKQEGAGFFNSSVRKQASDIITQRDIKNTFGSNEMVMKIVGIFRAFLICNNLLPDKWNKPIESKKERVINAGSIVNTCVHYFPFYYLGCGGCDMFNGSFAANVETVKQFLDMFPMTTAGGIINVSTFRSGDGGSHWMGLYTTNKKASLMCPQASEWAILSDRGELRSKLENCGFALENNMVCCQQDNCNCGVYSFLFLFMMLVKDSDMKAAVEQVGVDANNLYNNKKRENEQDNANERMIYQVKKAIFGY